MRCFPVLMLILLMAVPCRAQTGLEPQLRMSLDETSAVPGQSIVLRITVLVPTWMPEPPVFPTFEVPNVNVRVPARGTGPTSEQVDGETWSGVTRTYRVSPMRAGQFRIPADSVRVTFADPETRQPVRAELGTESFEISGVLPKEAEDLDPFIGARSLSLERTVEGDPGNLAAGDALILETVATISGASPMFLPPLAPIANQDGLAVYPRSPSLEETEERGVVSGKRSETVTVLAEFAGTYSIPEVSLAWYNLDSGRIETGTLPRIDLVVTGGPLPGDQAPESFGRSALFGLLVVLLLAGVVWAVARSLRRGRLNDFKGRVVAGEPYAYLQLRRHLRSMDFGRAMHAAIVWQQRFDRLYAHVDWRELEDAFAQIGASRFGPRNHSTSSGSGSGWRAVAQAARSIRRETFRRQKSLHARKLPPLNPAA